MSNIGTSVAAAVAQTALQAQQVARVRDKRRTQTDHAADRLRQETEERLSVLDEVDNESPDQLTIDARLPHHEQPAEETPDERQPQERPTAQAADETEATPVDADDANQLSEHGGSLYHHLDVRA